MNGCELGALRRHLLFSSAEAARWIAADSERPQGVEERTWNRWEAGTIPVPQNIAGKVLDLLAQRNARLIELQENVRLVMVGRSLQPKPVDKPIRAAWYADATDALGEGLAWRVERAALAELLAMSLTGGLANAAPIELVPFDAIAFGAWRRSQGLADGPAERAEWAAQVDLATPVRAKEGAAE